MKKLLIAVFTILLINVLGEFTYILYLQQKANNTPAPIITKNIQTIITPTPPTSNAININSLSMFTYWQKGVVSSANTTLKLKGTIIAIDTNGQVEEHGWPPVKYALKIRIEGENKEANDIFINQDELQKTVFKKTNANNTTTVIDYKELKLNDNIQATLDFDLTNSFSDNFVSAEIIKL